MEQVRRQFSFLQSILFWVTVNSTWYQKLIGIALGTIQLCYLLIVYNFVSSIILYPINSYLDLPINIIFYMFSYLYLWIPSISLIILNYYDKILVLIIPILVIIYYYGMCLNVNMLTYLVRYKRLSFRESLISLPHFFHSLWVYLLSSLIVIFSLPIFPLSFYLMIKYWFAFRICLDTDKSISDCFDMSSILTRGVRLKLFFVIILCFLLPFLYPFVMTHIYIQLITQVSHDKKSK